jgi:release factor glutamine methyltransferase
MGEGSPPVSGRAVSPRAATYQGGVTVGELYSEVRQGLRAAGVEDDGIEAEALVCAALDVEPAWFYANPESVPPADATRRVHEYVGRRTKREPLAYITGCALFYSRRFAVDPRVLVPRPETELLVERALTWPLADAPGPVRVADVGTGSGVLAITLAIEMSLLAGSRGVEVHAVDASEDALAVARANCETHGAGHLIRFYRGDLAAPLSGRFDIVVANLPYIRSAGLAERQPELQFEPTGALYGGEDGMRYVGPMIDALRGLLAPRALAVLEIDPPIAHQALKRARAAVHGARIAVRRDLSGLDRVLEVDLAGAGRGNC